MNQNAKTEFQLLDDTTSEDVIKSTMYTVVSLFFDPKDPEKIVDSLWNVARTEKAAVGYHDWLCDMMTDARYGQDDAAVVVLENASVDTDDPLSDVSVKRVSPLNSDDDDWRKLVVKAITGNWKLCLYPEGKTGLANWNLSGSTDEDATPTTTVKRGQKRPVSEKATTTKAPAKKAPAKKVAPKKAAPTAAAARKKASTAPAKTAPAKKAAPKANAARKKAA